VRVWLDGWPPWPHRSSPSGRHGWLLPRRPAQLMMMLEA
jgi:hypothetical protein